MAWEADVVLDDEYVCQIVGGNDSLCLLVRKLLMA